VPSVSQSVVTLPSVLLVSVQPFKLPSSKLGLTNKLWQIDPLIQSIVEVVMAPIPKDSPLPLGEQTIISAVAILGLTSLKFIPYKEASAPAF